MPLDPGEYKCGRCNKYHELDAVEIHHCARCGCIRGLDHHCSVLGTCISQDNQAYFILMLVCGGIYAGLLCYSSLLAEEIILCSFFSLNCVFLSTFALLECVLPIIRLPLYKLTKAPRHAPGKRLLLPLSTIILILILTRSALEESFGRTCVS